MRNSCAMRSTAQRAAVALDPVVDSGRTADRRRKARTGDVQ